jgi:hypothetical protein
VALRRAVAEAQRPLLGVVPVVGHLVDGLGRQRGRLAAGGRECLVQQFLVDREAELAGDGVGEVAVREFHQLHVVELVLLAQEGQLVLVPGERQQGAGLAQQVQRDVGEGDVLLQHRRVPGPLPQPLGQHQGVVAQRAGGGPLGRQRLGGGHRCFTPSGIS